MDNNPRELATAVEALLFSEGGPITRKKLAHMLGATANDVNAAIAELAKRERGGIALIENDTEIALAVAPSAARAVEEAFEKELGQEIGDAGLEVLAIVLYRGPSTRAGIDYIRGVNSSWTLRNLLSRGLLERAGNPEDAREYLYRPTIELLAHLGVQSGAELPEHAAIVAELAAFEQRQESEQHEDTEGTSVS